MATYDFIYCDIRVFVYKFLSMSQHQEKRGLKTPAEKPSEENKHKKAQTSIKSTGSKQQLEEAFEHTRTDMHKLGRRLQQENI